jgi:hypothetical protein
VATAPGVRPDELGKRGGRPSRRVSEQIRSPILTIFCHCRRRVFSFRTVGKAYPSNQPSTVLPQDAASKGLAMLIRSDKCGVQGGAAKAMHTSAIPAASLPTLLIGGLLLLIGP